MLDKKRIITLACDDNEIGGLLTLDKAALENMLGPEFATMKDYNQNNPHHCYDLLEHSVKAVLGIRQADSADRAVFENLRVAALFHDIGKPQVMTPDEKTGVSHYRHHAEKSAEIAQAILSAAGFGEKKMKQILFYIKNHDAFMYLTLPEEAKPGQPVINEENITEITHKVSESDGVEQSEFINLIQLCLADAGAQSEAVYGKNGRIKDSRELKIKRIKKIGAVLEALKMSNEKTATEFKNKSFVFIPFKAEPVCGKKASLFSDVKKTINESGVWDDYGEESKRYLLNYVADRIDCGKADNNDPICIVRKAKEEIMREAVKQGTSSSQYDIINIFLFSFDTSINLICIEIVFNETDYETITDKLFYTKSFNKKDNKDELYKKAVFLIDKMQEHSETIGFKLFTTTSEDQQRANILTYYETPKSDKEDLNKCLFRLSHCYKADFEYSEDSDDKCLIYKNNGNCHWGITSECAACVAYPEVDFVRNYFRKNFDTGYLMTFALILNQKYTLYKFQTDISKIPFEEKNPKTEEISKAQQKFYKFEKNYNFKTVSETPQYQNVYNLLFDANRIETLMKDVQEPMDALSSILKEKAEDADSKRETAINISLAVISLLTIWSALIDSQDFLDVYSGFTDFCHNSPFLIKLTLGIWTVLALFIIFNLCKIPCLAFKKALKSKIKKR